MIETKIEEFNRTTNTLSQSKPHPLPALTLDVDYFQGFLDDPDISEDEKRELIEVIWSIVVSVIDLGFGVHPVQQAIQDTSLRDGLASALQGITLENDQPQKEKHPEGAENEF